MRYTYDQVKHWRNKINEFCDYHKIVDKDNDIYNVIVTKKELQELAKIADFLDEFIFIADYNERHKEG